MPRELSSRSSRKRRNVQASLVIQYRDTRARRIIYTVGRDQTAQEKEEISKTIEDLKALNIIANGFYPSRYEIQWKHGMVNVGWRLPEDSFDHQDLKYRVRAAEEHLQEGRHTLDIANITWREDSRQIPMHSLPREPPQQRAKERESAASPPPYASSGQGTMVTILPPLSISKTGANIQFVPLNGFDGHSTPTQAEEDFLDYTRSPYRELVPMHADSLSLDGAEDGLASQNLQVEPCGDAPPVDDTEMYVQITSSLRTLKEPIHPRRHLARDNEPKQPIAGPSTPLEHKRYNSSSSPLNARSARLITPPSSEVYRRKDCRSPESQSSAAEPDNTDHIDFKLMQSLLVAEIGRRIHAEDVLKKERLLTHDLFTTSTTNANVLEGALSKAQSMQQKLELQLMDAQSDASRIKAILEKCRADLTKTQDALMVEQQERRRVAALLEIARKEYDSLCAVPAVTNVLSMIDGLTEQAMKTVI
ncbi:hypothetical protein BC835DRAFT_1417091 [Cytidiella melzeri]|nr:hypothetical protein BC835DRAFT_1417091 [Cytidiella melzeri]